RQYESPGGQKATSKSIEFKNHTRQKRAKEPSAGIRHVVEAHIYRDLVIVGVGEDEIRVHGRIDREYDHENGEPNHQRGSRGNLKTKCSGEAERDHDQNESPKTGGLTCDAFS